MPRTPSHDVLTNNGGEMVVDWLINTVTIFGPTADINDFKALCIVPASACSTNEKDRFELERIMHTPGNLFDVDRLAWRNDNWGAFKEPWGVEIDTSPDPWTFSFSFETGGGFPEPIFQCLAQRFPRLAFHCFSLEFNDAYLEIGWFNTPHGCSDFHEEEYVPPECPIKGPSRDPISELRYLDTVKELKRIAQAVEDRAK
jgi:hypothetical protein